MRTTTIRPGYMVGLKTALRGNVSYRVEDIDATQVDREVTRTWTTTRTTRDIEEYQRAILTRTKARGLVLRYCIKSDLVYLCPLTDYDALVARIEEAQNVVAEFNRDAILTTISFSVITGKIEANDALAIKSLNNEIRDLLADMTQGVASLNADAIRKAANQATQVSKMLSSDAFDRTKLAIEQARAAANKIAKAAKGASIEVDRVVIDKLTQARVAFIDGEGQDMPAIVAPTPQAGAIDLDRVDVSSGVWPKRATPAMDID